MLSRYMQAAMSRARYEILKDDKSYYGEIRGCRGVYANAPTLEECREALAATLEDWVLLRVHKHLPLPKIGGVELKVRKEKAA
jgi:predicted RNase H-like HicB family nuclease